MPSILVMKILDIQLEDMQTVSKTQVQAYVFQRNILAGQTNLKKPQTIQVPIDLKGEIRILLQALIDDEQTMVGSISFDQLMYFTPNNIEPGREYKQWITLFDDPADDLYDGVFGEDDEEQPRILVSIQVIDSLSAAKSQEEKNNSSVELPQTQGTLNKDSNAQRSSQQLSNKPGDAALLTPQVNLKSDAKPVQNSEQEISLVSVQKVVAEKTPSADKFNLREETIRMSEDQNNFTSNRSINQFDDGINNSQAYENMNKKTNAITSFQRNGKMNESLQKIGETAKGADIKNEISTLFGGNQKPKMASKVQNVRKAKDEALAWIRDEIKRYDQGEIESEIENKTQITIINISKEQKDTIKLENHQIRRLENIQQLANDLKVHNQQLRQQSELAAQDAKKVNETIQMFDKAREVYKAEVSEQVLKLKRQLELQNIELSQQQKQTADKTKQVIAFKEKDIIDGDKADAESLKARQTYEEVEKLVTQHQSQVEAAGLKSVSMTKNFQNLKTAYDSETQELENLLKVQQLKRNAAQEDHNKIEAMTCDEACRNIELKKLLFRVNSQVNQYSIECSRTERQVQLLQEKKRILLKDLELTQSTQKKEFLRVQKELSDLQIQLVKQKVDYEKTASSLAHLNQLNFKEKQMQWEPKIERLEAELRKADLERRDTQVKLENIHQSMKVKLGMLGDPNQEKAAQTKDFFANLDQQNQEYKQQIEALEKQRKNLEDLKVKKADANGRVDLTKEYQEAYEHLGKVTNDIQNQAEEIAAQIQRNKILVDERKNLLDNQVQELSKLRQQKNDQDREIQNLKQKTEELKKQNARLDDDIARLKDEKEQLSEQVEQLEKLVDARTADIEKSDRALRNADKQIDWLQLKMREQARNGEKVPISFKPSTGDLLDELIGQAISTTGCPVPIKKLGEGYYLFGTRKIFAKILNGRLIIRVGGGFVVIEEFISQYAEKELNAIDRLRQEGKDPHAPEKIDEMKRKHKNRGQFGGSLPRETSPPKSLSKAGSQKDLVYVGTTDVRMSGTFHKKKFTESQLNNMRINHPNSVRQIQ